MALSELQIWIMHELAAKGGTIEGLPTRAGITAEAMEQAIDGLGRRQYVLVVGPPNQNSDLGKDVDELHLLQADTAHLRNQRL